MDTQSQETIIIGYNAFPYRPNVLDANDETRLKFLTWKVNPNGRLLLALIQYLQQHTLYFKKIKYVLTFEQDLVFRNGTLKGLTKKINCSEIDIGVIPRIMNEYTVSATDFSYPLMLEQKTFMTRKPVYKPHIFGIFQTFSLPVWLTIISVLFAMPIVTYIISKRKYSFNRLSFHVLAILMRQSSLISPRSLMEKLLVYSWVVGAMFLCLAHDSVFLSFLSFPPVTKIKHLSDLALAVERGDYHCISYLQWGIAGYLATSKQEHFRLIGIDIVKNNLSYGKPFQNFFLESQKQNLAFFLDAKFLDIYAGNFYISEDRFYGTLLGMVVRRGFCCKELLDSFIHKISASGLYSKYIADGSFVSSLELTSQFPDPESTKRKLTLTDVAPAFIVLLSGYFISFLVLIAEIILNRKKMSSRIKHQKKERTRFYDETLV